MIGYAFKRITRSATLFAVLFGGVLISSTIFATVTLGTNELFLGMVNKSLEETQVDMEIGLFLNKMTIWRLMDLRNLISEQRHVQHAEIVTRVQWVELFGTDVTPSYWEAYVGIEDHSLAYDGINVIEGNTSLGPNEAWLVNSSSQRPSINLNDEVNISLIVILPNEQFSFVDFPLNVTGFVTVTDQALETLVGNAEHWRNTADRNLFIVNWNATFRPFMHDNFHLNLGFPLPRAFENQVLMKLDRLALVDAFDMQATRINLAAFEATMQPIADGFTGHITNYLLSNIDTIRENSQNLQINFLISSVPIFFIAVYLGITMSDVTFHLRRREIGLLITKGAKRPTIMRIFLFEALLIGIIVGFASIGIAILITPFLLGLQLAVNPLVALSLPSIAMSLLFSCAIAIISSFSAARRASKISVTEALREYSASAHPAVYRVGAVWIALILGAYKIIIWLTNLNPTLLLPIITYYPTFIQVLIIMWVFFDIGITPFAVLLFLYGFSKILIQGTQIIYKTAEKVMRRLMGGIGTFATRSIQRSPARTAVVVFILALVIGYGAQTLTVLASEQDYASRSIHANIGSDISTSVVPASNAQALIPAIQNITGVESVTAEYWTSLTLEGTRTITVRAINASQWPQTAYYEENWFSGVSFTDAIEALKTNNRTMILQREIAQVWAVSLGEAVNISVEDNFVFLTNIGYFGPGYYPEGALQPRRGYYSLITIESLAFLGALNDSTARLLIKIQPTADIPTIVTQLNNYTQITTIDSLQESLTEYALNPILNAPNNIMQIQVIFAFILASVGTAIIITTSFKEKELEFALMAARGSSFRQTMALLLGETSLWILFSLIIGLFTGFTASYGMIFNFAGEDPFIARTFAIVLSPAVLLQLLGLIILLITFAFLPVVQAARRAHKGAEVLRQ